MMQEPQGVSIELPLFNPKEDISSWGINCVVGFSRYDKERLLTHLVNLLPESHQIILFTDDLECFLPFKQKPHLFKIEQFPEVLEWCQRTHQTPKVLILDHNIDQIDRLRLKTMFFNGRHYRLSVFCLMDEITLAPDLRANVDNFFVFNPYKSTKERDQQHGETLIKRYDQFFMDDLDRFRSMWLIATHQPNQCFVISFGGAKMKTYWFMI